MGETGFFARLAPRDVEQTKLALVQREGIHHALVS
jgi:hypothetical protein